MRDFMTRTLVGRLLREERVRSGVKQTELAERLGVPQSFVSKYEIGERRLEFEEVQAICAALGLALITFAQRVETDRGRDDESAA